MADPPLMALSKGPLAGRLATMEDVAWGQMNDATYGVPGAPQPTMMTPRADSWPALASLVTGKGGRLTPQQVQGSEYGQAYYEWMNAQRSALAALGYDATRTIPPPNYDQGLNIAGGYVSGAYMPTPDVLFVDPRSPGTGSHEGMHRGIQKLMDKGEIEPVMPAENEGLVRASMIRRYGDDAEGQIGPTGGGLGHDQIRQGRRDATAHAEKLDRLEWLAAQMIAKRNPRGPR